MLDRLNQYFGIEGSRDLLGFLGDFRTARFEASPTSGRIQTRWFWPVLNVFWRQPGDCVFYEHTPGMKRPPYSIYDFMISDDLTG
jgi:hypothetical protein